MVKKKFDFNNLKVHHFPWILAIILMFFLTIVIFVYWQVSSRAEEAMVEQVKNHELTLARSGALAVSELFQERKANLLLLAEIEAVKAEREKEGRQAIRNLVDQLEGQILASIVRVDKEGRSLWSDNPQHKKVEEGVDLADRDYFLWAKAQKAPGEVFINQPVIARGGPREGEWIVVMTSPVFYQNKFDGLVFISFPLKDLTEKYVTPLISTPGTQSMIIAQDKTIIASSAPETLGKRASDYFQEQAEMITVKAPIKIGKQTWSLRVSIPRKEAVRLALPISVIQSQGLVLTLIGLFVLVLIFVLGVRVAQKDAFVDGFKNGQDGIKKAGKKI